MKTLEEKVNILYKKYLEEELSKLEREHYHIYCRNYGVESTSQKLIIEKYCLLKDELDKL